MKILILCVCVLAAAGIVQANAATERIANLAMITEKQVDTCMQKAGFTEDDIVTLIKTKANPNGEASARFGCFLACVAELKGIFANGEFVMDKIKEYMDAKVQTDNKEKLYSAAETCVETTEAEDNPCVKMVILIGCIGQKMKS